MLHVITWFQRRFSGRGQHRARAWQAGNDRRVRLHVEQLEPRCVPSYVLTKLADFNGSNGSDPEGGVIQDSSGNLFGTTFSGGAKNDGTLYEYIKSSGKIQVLSFNGANGNGPSGDLVQDASGNLFGTTQMGGANNDGTVFEFVKSSGTIHFASFDGTNGSEPFAGLFEDASGNLFGTTNTGGGNSNGTLYKYVPSSNTIEVLASFPPTSSVTLFLKGRPVADTNGNLFMTAAEVGAFGQVPTNPGEIFKYDPKTGNLSDVASFNGTNGILPSYDMVEDANGNFFGVSFYGGTNNNFGTLWQYVPSSNTIKLLVKFNQANGQNPYGELALDASGNLFGTTQGAGAANTNGLVFEYVTSQATLKVITPFTGMNGSIPNGVIVDSAGNLFGSTQTGGASNDGVLFKVVNQAPQTAPTITSANHVTFTVGSRGTFTVTTTGNPTPRISETVTLPQGVTFTDNGNGTATLAGTPAAGTGGVYLLNLTASNGVNPNATQTLVLTVNEAPSITSDDVVIFVVGMADSVDITTNGFPTPTLTESGMLPDDLRFIDNGDGTASLFGTPAAGTAGSYPLVITASNGVGRNATQNLTLLVYEPPAIISDSATTFVEGNFGDFNIEATGTPTARLTESGSLPAGVSIQNGNGVAELFGTPAAGTAGMYPLTITASNGVGDDATQNFMLIVEPPPVPGWTPLTSHVFVTAADAGGQPKVQVFDAASGNLLDDFFAFDAGLTTGVRVAAGDLNGTGIPDIIAIPGPGAPAIIRIFDGETGNMTQFTPFVSPDGQLFNGGGYLAAADIFGHGYDDIIVGADAGGGPAVSIVDGRSGQTAQVYYAFDPDFTGGVRVAAGPYTPGGSAAIFTAAGPGGGPAVTIWSAADIAAGNPEKTFYVLPPDANGNLFTGGVYLGATYVSRLGRDYLVSGAAPGGGPAVTLIDPLETTGAIGAFVSQPFYAFDPSFTGGVRAAGGSDVVFVGPGAGTAAIAESFSLSGNLLNTFDGSDSDNPNFSGGLFVAAL